MVNQNNKTPKAVTYDAHAPYNFVPLNDKVVEFDKILDLKLDKDENLESKEDSEIYGLSKFHDGANSGFIELEIEALTAIFVGDSNKNSTMFYNINNNYQIPASSLRGIIKTLVEVASYSKFMTFNDSRFYFRDVAGKSGNSLKSIYSDKLVRLVISEETNTKKTEPKSEAGFLQKIDSRHYQIVPVKMEKRLYIDKFGTDSYKYPKMKIEYTNKGYEVYSGYMKSFKKDKKSGKKIDTSKKHYYEFNLPDKNIQAFTVPYETIKLYKEDNLKQQPQRKRSGFINLLDELEKYTKKYPHGVPCFYIKNEIKNEVEIFGHTPYFRIPYSRKISSSIPLELRNKTKFDLSEAIFGKETIIASRVFFEDAKLKSEAKFEKEENLILSSPKPTSYNLYLENTNLNNISQIKHYDSPESKIRGYKFYHHKNHRYENTPQSSITKTVKPLSKGAKFKGKIRFENLSDIELGALLFVLNLPKNCQHKIGMGKPLGFGSIDIKTTLKLVDIKERYANVFDTKGGFYQPVKSGIDMSCLKKEFEKFILEKIDSKNTSLWDEDRLKELKVMLDFTNKDKLKNRSYMELDSFKHKTKILPRPSEL
ncbi:TIGR03986 family type III CRISPR-associated RAMP protein [Campylobacter geochelonis]|uniref:CRISPR-associated protein n=1 Tax=Campylobacter geochelonis TaxID=1780362 RepID=A0A128EDA5_9BACT|nr:TIGR03986 family CRISPR-associated RAMP protein [Campylobacter geochelonis]QKF70396.1 CRISPR/Cas system-associated RAMP protein, type III [Campylobacter geochelonis]CZE46372.1 CRISPR-associated protein [Campylobacter geochelonis]